MLGTSQLVLGAFIAIAPGSFFDSLAGFGARNDHFLRDTSTFYLALGVVLLLAAGRSSWRSPVLAFATIEYSLHSLNHLLDIGDADPGWIGPFDFASLAAVTAIFVYLLAAVARAPR